MNENDPIRTIEINGVKIEVDLRTAKKIESYKVGDRVKVLYKKYSGYRASPGVIVGIDAFKNLPTIVIAYIEDPLSYSGDAGQVTFAYLNAESNDVEICPMCEDDIVPTRDTMRVYFDRAIQKKAGEVEEMKMRKEYFLRQYGIAFGVAAEEVAEALASNE